MKRKVDSFFPGPQKKQKTNVSSNVILATPVFNLTLYFEACIKNDQKIIQSILDKNHKSPVSCRALYNYYSNNIVEKSLAPWDWKIAFVELYSNNILTKDLGFAQYLMANLSVDFLFDYIKKNSTINRHELFIHLCEKNLIDDSTPKFNELIRTLDLAFIIQELCKKEPLDIVLCRSLLTRLILDQYDVDALFIELYTNGALGSKNATHLIQFPIFDSYHIINKLIKLKLFNKNNTFEHTLLAQIHWKKLDNIFKTYYFEKNYPFESVSLILPYISNFYDFFIDQFQFSTCDEKLYALVPYLITACKRDLKNNTFQSKYSPDQIVSSLYIGKVFNSKHVKELIQLPGINLINLIAGLMLEQYFNVDKELQKVLLQTITTDNLKTLFEAILPMKDYSFEQLVPIIPYLPNFCQLIIEQYKKNIPLERLEPLIPYVTEALEKRLAAQKETDSEPEELCQYRIFLQEIFQNISNEETKKRVVAMIFGLPSLQDAKNKFRFFPLTTDSSLLPELWDKVIGKAMADTEVYSALKK